MKKVRIMLAAIVVLGSVGGALAFKAKTFSPDRYCYKTAAAGTCIAAITAGYKTVSGAGDYYYTTTFNAANCNQATCQTRIVGFVKE